MTSNLLRNPLEGNYTVDSDREVVEPVLVRIAQRYAEYASSGSDAWDATIDVHSRPLWLKQLAGVEENTSESPAVNPLMADVANTIRPFRPTPAGGGTDNHTESEGFTSLTALQLKSKVHPEVVNGNGSAYSVVGSSSPRNSESPITSVCAEMKEYDVEEQAGAVVSNGVSGIQSEAPLNV